MKGGEDEGMSLGDSLDYAKQGLGMLQGDVAPVPIMRFADGGFRFWWYRRSSRI